VPGPTSGCEEKRLRRNPATVSRYKTIIIRFVQSLGTKADRDLEAVTSADVTKFRDSEAKRLSVVSANLALKIVRALLSDAHARQYIPRNPAAICDRCAESDEDLHVLSG
jgi:site-specific recombinase XerD